MALSATWFFKSEKWWNLTNFFGTFTSFEKWLTFFEHDQIEAVSVVNVGVYNFSTLAFFFWEKIAFEISVCNIHLVAMSGHWWSIILFFTKIENVKKRVNFGAVFSLEGVVFLIQSIKQKLFSSIFYFQNTPDFNS